MVDFWDGSLKQLPLAGETLEKFHEVFLAASPYFPANRRMRTQIVHSFRVMLAEEGNYNQAGAKLRTERQFAELIVLLVRCCAGAPQESPKSPSARLSISGTVDWLRRDYCKPASVQELAAFAGLSYRSYTKGFKQATGETVVGYCITRRRVDYAARLMLESDNILD